jgi:hypothetical protein
MSQTVEKPPAVGAAVPDKQGRLGRWGSALFSALVLLAAAIGFLATAVEADLPVRSAAAALAGLLITQVVPGFLVWRVVRPLQGWWIEDVAMGLAVGFMLAIGAQTVAGWTGLTWVSGGVGIGVAVLLLIIPLTRRRILRVRVSRLPLWWTPVVAATSLLGLQDLLRYYPSVPLTWDSGFRTPHIDAYLHLALAGELQHRGPISFPWVENAPMAYHWFSHAWVAQVATVSGAGLDEVLFRFMPALMPLTIVLVVAIAAVRLTGRPWTGPVAAVLAMAGSELNLFGLLRPGYPMSPLSPSLAPSVPLLIAIVLLLAFRWRGGMSRAGLVLLPLLALAAAGTKGSTMPLVVAGVGLAFAAMILFDRSRLRSVLLDVLLMTGMLVLALVVVFQGSDSGLHVQLHDAALSTPTLNLLGEQTGLAMTFASVVTVLGILARGTGLLWRFTTAEGRRDPMTWLLAGGGFAGAAAVAVFAHPGASQYYFARTAGPLLALGSAIGLATMIDRLGSRAWRAIVVGVALGPAFVLLPLHFLGVLRPGPEGFQNAVKMLGIAALVLVVAGVIALLLTPGLRVAAFGAAVTCAILAGGITTVVRLQVVVTPVAELQPVPATSQLAVGRGQIDAARWIRDHSSVHDLVMTNRHCTVPVEPVGCDSRRFVVGAFSERQMLVEAWTPTVEANKLGPEGRESITVDYWKPDILALNDGFIAKPDEDMKQRLQQLGVRWIMVDFTRPHAHTLEPFAQERMRNGWAAVYELPPAG